MFSFNCRAWDLEKFQSALNNHRKEIFQFFLLQFYYGAWESEKISIELDRLRFFFLAVVLWCMGLRKTSIGTRPPPKKKLFLATVLLWCIEHKEIINRYSTLAKKKILFKLLHKHDAGDLEKFNRYLLDPHQKKMFLATALIWCMVLIISINNRLSPKKNIFVSITRILKISISNRLTANSFQFLF